jgi:hypothetical protein
MYNNLTAIVTVASLIIYGYPQLNSENLHFSSFMTYYPPTSLFTLFAFLILYILIYFFTYSKVMYKIRTKIEHRA